MKPLNNRETRLLEWLIENGEAITSYHFRMPLIKMGEINRLGFNTTDKSWFKSVQDKKTSTWYWRPVCPRFARIVDLAYFGVTDD